MAHTRGTGSDYRIHMRKDGTLVLYTHYKGHNFDGWISLENFSKAESQGVLSWDASGNPVIRPELLQPVETPSCSP